MINSNEILLHLKEKERTNSLRSSSERGKQNNEQANLHLTEKNLYNVPSQIFDFLFASKLNVEADRTRAILELNVVRYRRLDDVDLRMFPIRQYSCSMSWCRWSSPEEYVGRSTLNFDRWWRPNRSARCASISNRFAMSIPEPRRPCTTIDAGDPFEYYSQEEE